MSIFFTHARMRRRVLGVEYFCRILYVHMYGKLNLKPLQQLYCEWAGSPAPDSASCCHAASPSRRGGPHAITLHTSTATAHTSRGMVSCYFSALSHIRPSRDKNNVPVSRRKSGQTRGRRVTRFWPILFSNRSITVHRLTNTVLYKGIRRLGASLSFSCDIS